MKSISNSTAISSNSNSSSSSLITNSRIIHFVSRTLMRGRTFYALRKRTHLGYRKVIGTKSRCRRWNRHITHSSWVSLSHSFICLFILAVIDVAWSNAETFYSSLLSSWVNLSLSSSSSFDFSSEVLWFFSSQRLSGRVILAVARDELLKYFIFSSLTSLVVSIRRTVSCSRKHSLESECHKETSSRECGNVFRTEVIAKCIFPLSNGIFARKEDYTRARHVLAALRLIFDLKRSRHLCKQW